MMSSSPYRSSPWLGEHNSSMLLSSAYPLQVVLMSAYTDSRATWRTAVVHGGQPVDQMWMLINGRPGGQFLKHCMPSTVRQQQLQDVYRAEMYDPSTSVPSPTQAVTVFPSSISSKDLILVFILTSPPLCSTTTRGWLAWCWGPSKKAILLPCPPAGTC